MSHSECYINGIWYPSVTTILAAKPKPWLDAWKEKWGLLAFRKTKMASAIGDEFHRCIESWINTSAYTIKAPTIDGFAMPSTITRVEGMVKSWIAWAMMVDGTIDHTELQVVSRTHAYSGSLDAVGTFESKPVLYDWKTSAKIYDDYHLQLAAYAQAYNEQTGGRVKDGLIVCVSKDKPHFKVTTKHFKLGKRPLKEFLKLREMFDDIQAKGESDAKVNDSEASGC